MTTMNINGRNAIIYLDNGTYEIIKYPYEIRGTDIRKIQLASCINGYWITKYNEVENALRYVKSLKPKDYYAILETFDVFNTKNEDPISMEKESEIYWILEEYPNMEKFLIQYVIKGQKDKMLKHISMVICNNSIVKCLEMSEIYLYGELLKMSDKEILKVRGIGKKRLQVIKKFMK